MLHIFELQDGTRYGRDAEGRIYIAVTSAIKLVKALLEEPAERYGSTEVLQRVHQAEGEACHAICLNWLAKEAGWIDDSGTFPAPPWHPDQRQWANTLSIALDNWMLFCKQYEVEPIGIEQESYSKKWGLMGHVDLYAWLKWRGKRIRGILDLKFTRSILPTHCLQVRTYYCLDGFERAQASFLYHAPRSQAASQLIYVPLQEGQDDMLAVSYAAQLYSWAIQKQRTGGG